MGNRRAEVLYLQQWEKNEMKEECVLRVAEDDVRRKQQKKLKKLERKSHAKVCHHFLLELVACNDLIDTKDLWSNEMPARRQRESG